MEEVARSLARQGKAVSQRGRSCVYWIGSWKLEARNGTSGRKPTTVPTTVPTGSAPEVPEYLRLPFTSAPYCTALGDGGFRACVWPVACDLSARL